MGSRKETEIIEGNRLIAEFMELRLVGEIYMNTPDKVPFIIGLVEELKYHTSWDWLMPVVEKIEKMAWEATIFSNHCNINRGEYKDFGYTNGKDKKEAVYKAVVEFIKWHKSLSAL